MHALQRPFKVFLEICEGPGKRAGPRDEDIVMVRARLAFAEKADGGAQTPFNAVALDRPAHLLGYRESEPRCRGFQDLTDAGARKSNGGRIWQPGARFQNERGRCAPRAAPYPQEFSSFLESDQRQSQFSRSYVSRSRNSRPWRKDEAKTLARYLGKTRVQA